MSDLKRYKRIQELLDEGKDPGYIIRESNSEIVWRIWDESVRAFDPSVGENGNRFPTDYSRFIDNYPSNWDTNC